MDNQIILTSTPTGTNYFYDVYKKHQRKNEKPHTNIVVIQERDIDVVITVTRKHNNKTYCARRIIDTSILKEYVLDMDQIYAIEEEKCDNLLNNMIEND